MDSSARDTPISIRFPSRRLAYWDTDQAVLDRGLGDFVQRVTGRAPEVAVVAFSTNSRRRAAGVPSPPGVRVRFLTAAGKPVRVGQYQDLPHDGVVLGDQVATDGLLAWRLGYRFLHYRPRLARVPAGPRLMHQLGHPLRPLLFTRSSAR